MMQAKLYAREGGVSVILHLGPRIAWRQGQNLENNGAGFLSAEEVVSKQPGERSQLEWGRRMLIQIEF